MFIILLIFLSWIAAIYEFLKELGLPRNFRVLVLFILFTLTVYVYAKIIKWAKNDDDDD